MDAAEIVVTVGGLVLIVLTLWFFLGKRHRQPPSAPGLYACPMHPWITGDQPSATCTQCGMALVRRDSGAKE